MADVWDLWLREWTNASRFFSSKGNNKTRSRLKDKWYKEFRQIIMLVEKQNKEVRK